MKRRRILATAGLGVSAVAAGCLDQFDARAEQGTGDEPDENAAPNASEATSVAAGETVERDPGSGTLPGGRRHPHTAFVTNPTETERTVALRIDQNGTTRLDESFSIDAGGAVAVEITDLAAYTVEATVTGTGEAETTNVERDQFDCNATSVTMTLQPDGTVSASTLSTSMACGNVPTDRVESGDRVEHTVGTVDDADERRARHTVRVTNPTAHTWPIHVLLGDGERTQFDGLFTVEPDASVDVRFDRTESDSVDGRVLDTDAAESVALDEADIGACNAATTTLELTDAGTIEASTIATDLACHSDDA